MWRLNFKYKTLTLCLVIAILLGSPSILLSQAKSVGVLSIFRSNAVNSGILKVNGNNAIDDQTIISPSVIETSISESRFTINVDKTGRLEIDSNSKMSLAFDENKFTGFLSHGRVTIYTCPRTTLNIQTKDGFISVPDQNQENIIVLEFIDGKTIIKPIKGSATFNKTHILTGQYFVAGEQSAVTNVSLEKSNVLFYIFAPLEITVLSLFADKSDLVIDNTQVNVGPIR